MENMIGYKIEAAYELPYEYLIDGPLMSAIEKNNQIISSSRIYFICQLKKEGFLSKKYSRPHVLYIGETFNKEKRFPIHNKLLKSTALIGRKDRLSVYFLNMRYIYLGFPLFTQNPWVTFDEIKDLHSKTSVRIFERLFIKLFNPPLNNKHKDFKLSNDPIIKSTLLKNQIKHVHLDIGMTSKHFQFSGGHVIPTEDWYNFDLLSDSLSIGLPKILENE